jgi:predicted dehydrogenase
MAAVRWAVVGTSGFALDWIARGISLGGNSELAAIVSRDRERGRAAAERTGAQHHYTSVDEIDMGAVDGVFVVTPNQLHAPISIAAARRGLHVICEKPMAPSLAECQEMVETARRANVVLAVAHCMHWTPPVVRARELIQAGALGTIATAAITASYNAPPSDRWRQADTTDAGGGPLYDMGVHAIDTIQSLVGPITEVSAFLDHHVYDLPAEETSTTLVRFESGAHGMVSANGNCSQNSFEIAGNGGRLWSTQWWGRDFVGNLWLEQGGQTQELSLERVNVYVPQIEHVSECILRGEQPVIAGERGMRDIAVIRAAVESSRSGCRVSVDEVA